MLDSLPWHSGKFVMADPLDSCGKWFIPEPSLTAQFEREFDRRKAAALGRDDLNILADKLIVDWYQHEAAINLLLARVRHLEVELVLSRANPSRREPDARHIEMAREVISELERNSKQ